MKNVNNNCKTCSQETPTVSSLLVECPECPGKFFRGNRGLKIHSGKIHKYASTPVLPLDPSCPSSTSPDTNRAPLHLILGRLKTHLPIIKRIPRGARASVTEALCKVIDGVVKQNSYEDWEKLLTFAYRTLHVKKSNVNEKSLTKTIKENCLRPPLLKDILEYSLDSNSKSRCPDLIKLVENKVSDGDLKVAAKLLFSDDTLAPNSTETVSSLLAKHPGLAPNSNFPPPPDPRNQTPKASVGEVRATIFSFRSGSAAGLDGLSPQHYKDMLGNSVHSDVFLLKLTALVNLMLGGSVPDNITDTLYGANLCALKKKDGSLRPIAIGNTVRRLVSKICCRHIRHLTADFEPIQLGFGSNKGCEAAVHAVRTFLSHKMDQILLKVDVKNAFNSINRGALLTQVYEKVPEIYPYLRQCYQNSSNLLFQENLIYSAEGCQQGDPLGPAIFSLTIHPIVSNLTSKLNLWYLDDGTLGDDEITVLNDLNNLIQDFKSVGLELNYNKCELYIPDIKNDLEKNTILSKFNLIAPNIKLMNKESLSLLGAPVLDEAIPSFVETQISTFRRTSQRLREINAHMALTIVRFCLFVPKFTYFLRSTFLWRHKNLLNLIDSEIQNFLSGILNCPLDAKSWSQASLPIRFGGIGIRSLRTVALPAFLSSAHGSHPLFEKIISPSLGNVEIVGLCAATEAWHTACPNANTPAIPTSQKQWDEPICEHLKSDLISKSNVPDRARLLAVSQKEAGLWLQALPSKHIGTVLDNCSLRIIISLRLGLRTCLTHRCVCGDNVDILGHHGLSCKRSAGRISRHAAINDIIRRALVSANTPSILEPPGIVRDDGKRPDGVTLVPWARGKPLVWDATCVDTLAPSHVSATAGLAGAAASSAENIKRRKYSSLSENYIFAPFGVETMGAWGPNTKAFIKTLSKRLIDTSGDPRAGSYLGQRISLAIQRGNAASLLGTLPQGDALNEIYYL